MCVHMFVCFEMFMHAVCYGTGMGWWCIVYEIGCVGEWGYVRERMRVSAFVCLNHIKFFQNLSMFIYYLCYFCSLLYWKNVASSKPSRESTGTYICQTSVLLKWFTFPDYQWSYALFSCPRAVLAWSHEKNESVWSEHSRNVRQFPEEFFCSPCGLAQILLIYLFLVNQQ